MSVSELDIKKFRKGIGKTQQQFAEMLNVSRNTIVNWEAGGNIDDTTMQRVTAFMQEYVIEMPDIPILRENESGREWRATNLKDSKYTKDLIPFWENNFFNHAGSFEDEIEKTPPKAYMDVPEFQGCVAFRANTDAMNDVIKPGSILFVTKINDWTSHLEFGQIYWIICRDGRKYLRYIRRFRENPKEFFYLESENKVAYDEFELPKDSIDSIWLVHGHLSKRV